MYFTAKNNTHCNTKGITATITAMHFPSHNIVRWLATWPCEFLTCTDTLIHAGLKNYIRMMIWYFLQLKFWRKSQNLHLDTKYLCVDHISIEYIYPEISKQVVELQNWFNFEKKVFEIMTPEIRLIMAFITKNLILPRCLILVQRLCTIVMYLCFAVSKQFWRLSWQFQLSQNKTKLCISVFLSLSLSVYLIILGHSTW